MTDGGAKIQTTPRDFVDKVDGPEVVRSAQVNIDEIVLHTGGAVFRDVFPFVLSIVSEVRQRNNVQGISQEDLVAVALLALARSCWKYRPQSGKLTTYAQYKIRGALQDYIERERRYLGANYMVDPEVFHQIEGPNHFEGAFSDQQLLRKVLEALADKIDPRAAEIIRRHFLEGVPEYEIAEEMGLTAYRVAQIREQGFHEIRQAVGRPPRGSKQWVAGTDN